MGAVSLYVSKFCGYGLYGLWDNAWRGLRAARRGVNFRPGARDRTPGGTTAAPPWWARPGLGVMFQIEARPGWSWQRNFDRFNASLTGPGGRLRFNGPLPQMADWVAFSKRIGCDYHTFEAKWHDGICYWDTPLTAWKTPVDYCRVFADESRAAGIPHGFYYSVVFDHNPDFDDIQPLRRATSSFLGMRGGKRAAVKKSLGFTQFIRLVFWLMERQVNRAGIHVERPRPFFDAFRLNAFTYDPDRYCRYVLAQLDELCGRYGAHTIWTDWFGADGEALSDEVMDFMQLRYPEVALAFNTSIIRDVRWAHYLSWEAHGLASTWKQVSAYRRLMRPWELITPAAANWDAPQPKVNPVENAQTAALIMAAGGKALFGIAAEMDGSLCPEVTRQLEHFGDWLRRRRALFVDARPLQYAGRTVPGVSADDPAVVMLGAELENDRLLHVFDLRAAGHARHRPLRILFSAPHWGPIEQVILEPSNRQLAVARHANTAQVEIPADGLDAIDTILRMVCRQ